MTTVSDTAVTTLRLGGAPVGDALLAQAKEVVAGMPTPPRLVAVLVGHHAASELYVAHKLTACAALGMAGEVVRLRAEDGETALHSLLHGLVRDSSVQAVIVQLPLPDGWDAQAALDMVPPEKDCDGLSTASAALRASGNPRAIAPATPLGVMRLLRHIQVEVRGRKVAVIGNGLLVGKPLRAMLAEAGAMVVAIDRGTPHPQTLARAAEIVVSAAGVPGLVTRDWLQPGATVIDVGLSRVEGIQLEPGKKVPLRGDVLKAEAQGIARWLTPVPGGVGPLTVASLMTNIIDCARLQMGLMPYVWEIPGHPEVGK